MLSHAPLLISHGCWNDTYARRRGRLGSGSAIDGGEQKDPYNKTGPVDARWGAVAAISNPTGGLSKRRSSDCGEPSREREALCTPADQFLDRGDPIPRAQVPRQQQAPILASILSIGSTRPTRPSPSRRTSYALQAAWNSMEKTQSCAHPRFVVRWSTSALTSIHWRDGPVPARTKELENQRSILTPPPLRTPGPCPSKRVVGLLLQFGHGVASRQLAEMLRVGGEVGVSDRQRRRGRGAAHGCRERLCARRRDGARRRARGLAADRERRPLDCRLGRQRS